MSKHYDRSIRGAGELNYAACVLWVTENYQRISRFLSPWVGRQGVDEVVLNALDRLEQRLAQDKTGSLHPYLAFVGAVYDELVERGTERNLLTRILSEASAQPVAIPVTGNGNTAGAQRIRYPIGR